MGERYQGKSTLQAFVPSRYEKKEKQRKIRARTERFIFQCTVGFREAILATISVLKFRFAVVLPFRRHAHIINTFYT